MARIFTIVLTTFSNFLNEPDFYRKIRLRQFVATIVLQLHAKFWEDPMTGYREKLRTNGRTSGRTWVQPPKSVGPRIQQKQKLKNNSKSLLKSKITQNNIFHIRHNPSKSVKICHNPSQSVAIRRNPSQSVGRSMTDYDGVQSGGGPFIGEKTTKMPKLKQP